MDLKIIAVISLTIIVVTGLVCLVFVARWAFAENAPGLEKDEAELILRVGTVGIVVMAGIFFGLFDLLDKAIPFLSPIAAFVLGGIKARTK